MSFLSGLLSSVQVLNPVCEAQALGYGIISTSGTAAALKAAGVDCQVVLKIQEGRPNASDLMKNGEIQMLMITSTGRVAGSVGFGRVRS